MGRGEGRRWQFTVVVIENVAVSNDRDFRQIFCYRSSFDIDTNASEWIAVLTRTTGQSLEVDGVETLVTCRPTSRRIENCEPHAGLFGKKGRHDNSHLS